MRKKLEITKSSLKKILSRLPSDFSLFEVKRHIRLAIDRIEDIEKRNEKKKLKKEGKSENVVKLNAAALGAVNNMIDNERELLKKLQEENKKGLS